jgi:catechol 2,3-dioxygenase-like lactoylglutathione lyase family enzyme
MILDHVSVPVRDLARAKPFYTKALKPLGISLVMEVPGELTGNVDCIGFGRDDRPQFWIGEHKDATPTGIHVAFVAETRADVDAFHAAALAAGGTDHGKPGLRPHYHANYYGAFILDPDGNNIEAVCHVPV